MQKKSLFYSIILSVAALTSGCANLPENVVKDNTMAVIALSEASDAKQAFHANRQSDESLSGFMLLGDGRDAFVARAAMADKAQRSIDLKTFIFKDDVIGDAVLGVLENAANRGIRVRLLLDDLWLGEQDDRFLAFNAHPNIEVRLFNPLVRTSLKKTQYITRFGSVTRRMHNKAFIVDNDIMVIGGRNIAREYFEAKPHVAYGDVDAIVAGPVVQDISSSFDEFWNHQLSYPIDTLIKEKMSNDEAELLRAGIAQANKVNGDSVYANALHNSELADRLKTGNMDYFWGKARAIADSPDKIISDRDQIDLHMSGELSKLFENTSQEVIIFTPYFIPGKEGALGLSQLAEQGKRVRILTNSLASNNHTAVHAHYTKYRKQLLRSGVEIYEVQQQPTTASESDKNQVLHAKLFVFDRQHTFIGSPNMDPRSWIENTEIGAVLDSPELGKEIGNWFDYEALKTAYKVELRTNDKGKEFLVWTDSDGNEQTKEPDVSGWKRSMNTIYRFLPIESQL